MSTLGNNIKVLREERGLTRQELAKELGISLSALGNYERGDRTPDADLIITLAYHFGVSSDFILGLTYESGQSIGDREGPGKLTVIYADIESVRTAWDLGVPIEPRKRAVTLSLTNRQCDELAVRGHEEIVSAVVSVPVRGRAPRIVLDPEEVINHDLG